ncbi:DUF962-domain-containing protein [Sparassis latifolia]|uniref:DUF962-domain-containing protein n=1 Tax=Sparassis crispa TaxID=139825 RepID=A0A401GB40_9APHY|nr:DUF962-domain-containing protein [Sparassis crispa]GBE79388.1 DUF962-domain-containing protein [Sparassis crispa]
MTVSIFSVKEQLTFYGAYHNNPTNVLIHKCCVPLLLWSFQVLMVTCPVPAFFPPIHVNINEYLAFDLNWATIHAILYIVYYFILEPTAALIYIPQMTLSLLAATSFALRSNGVPMAVCMNVGAWIAQFIGHYGPEGRAPALLDNIVGALVLAPFFVHLEILFSLGYKPELRKNIHNGVGQEILRVKKAEAAKKRGKEL